MTTYLKEIDDQIIKLQRGILYFKNTGVDKLSKYDPTMNGYYENENK